MSIEGSIKNEKINVPSKIRLVFLRHAEKTGAHRVDGVDKKISLTEHGRQTSIEKGKEGDYKQAIAVGSSRDRTQETALYVLGGKNNNVTGNESQDELESKLSEEIGLQSNASRLTVDTRLDMPFEKGGREHLELEAEWEKGLYFKAIVDKHDLIVKNKGSDRGESTYSIQARNIAEIIKKYVGVSPRWDRLFRDTEKEYEPTLERILSTHGGISESFLAELIDRTRGREARDNFINAFPNAVDFLEGFEFEIIRKPDGETTLHLNANIPIVSNNESFVIDEDIPLDLIEEIINDFSAIGK